MLEPDTVLDKIRAESHWTEPATDIQERILAETELLAAMQDKVKKGAKFETAKGIAIGAHPRKNIRMTIHLNEAAQKEWGCEKIVSDTIYAKNNPIGIENAVTSSFNRYADTVTLLRSSLGDCYAGRVDTLKKAQEMAQFIFLGEIDQFDQGTSRGITQREDGVFELTFMAQSLLNMVGFEKELYEKEKAAYQELSKTTQSAPLTITHPITGKVYPVVVKQVPMAATPCNWIKHVEKATPNALSGARAAMKDNEISNAYLAELAKEKIKVLREKSDFETIAKLEDSLEILKTPGLKPWREIMTRSYVLHLLGIPPVINCKSSCDRTGGFAIPLVFAMNQWIQAGRPIPKVGGKYCIYEIVRQNDSVKELIAAKLQQEVKTSEYSRGEKGLKINEKGVPNPAYKDIWPERYLDRGSNVLPEDLRLTKDKHRHGYVFMTKINVDAPEVKDRQLVY